MEWLAAVPGCLGRYLCYILPFAGVLVVIRLTCRVPRELFRKLLHSAAFTSPPVIMALSSGDWRVSSFVLFAFGAVVWPVLAAFERFPWFSELFVERRTHEIRRSLLVLFWGMAALVALCWGGFGRRDLASAAILMWGFGDAAAALVGKRWGRHRTGLPRADPKKTWEGSAALCVVSTAVGTACLVLLSGLPFVQALAFALVTSVIGAYVELVTKRGNDTITVPTANAVVLIILAYLFR